MDILAAVIALVRRRPDPQVEADARAFVERHGEHRAYYQATMLAKSGRDFDGKPARHWSAVRLRVAEMVGHEIGGDQGARRERDRLGRR